MALRRFETGCTALRASPRDRIETALTDAGIELLEDEDIGVKLRQRM